MTSPRGCWYFDFEIYLPDSQNVLEARHNERENSSNLSPAQILPTFEQDKEIFSKISSNSIHASNRFRKSKWRESARHLVSSGMQFCNVALIDCVPDNNIAQPGRLVAHYCCFLERWKAKNQSTGNSNCRECSSGVELAEPSIWTPWKNFSLKD